MPEEVLALSSADAGVWGEGEFALPELATRLERGQDWHDLANLRLEAGRDLATESTFDPVPRRSAPHEPELGGQPPLFPRRRTGGVRNQAGLSRRVRLLRRPRGQRKTARGRGRPSRRGRTGKTPRPGHRPPAHLRRRVQPAAVACPGSVPAKSRGAVWATGCAGTPIARPLRSRPSWPGPCGEAGCVGINFGADNGDPGMLRRWDAASRPPTSSTPRAGRKRRAWPSCSICCSARRERLERAWRGRWN